MGCLHSTKQALPVWKVQRTTPDRGASGTVSPDTLSGCTRCCRHPVPFSRGPCSGRPLLCDTNSSATEASRNTRVLSHHSCGSGFWVQVTWISRFRGPRGCSSGAGSHQRLHQGRTHFQAPLRCCRIWMVVGQTEDLRLQTDLRSCTLPSVPCPMGSPGAAASSPPARERCRDFREVALDSNDAITYSGTCVVS